MNALHVRLVPDKPRLAPVPARSNRAVISTSMLHANDQIWHQMRTEPYGFTKHLVLLEFRIGPRSCVETAQGRETRQHAETRQHEERLTRLDCGRPQTPRPGNQVARALRVYRRP